MSLPDDDPAAYTLATVEGRRRAGRQDVSPELIPILRGQVVADAPADPDIPPPPAIGTRQEWLTGAALAATLLLVGLALRFLV